MTISASAYYAYQQTQKDDEPLRLPSKTKAAVKQAIDAGQRTVLKSKDTPNGKVALVKANGIYSIIVGKKMVQDFDDEETALRVFTKYQRGVEK